MRSSLLGFTVQVPLETMPSSEVTALAQKVASCRYPGCLTGSQQNCLFVLQAAKEAVSSNMVKQQVTADRPVL